MGSKHRIGKFRLQAKTLSRIAEINMKDTGISTAFDSHLVGPATVEVPRFIQNFLAE